MVEVDTTQPLTLKEIKCIQDIVGTFLYYVQAVDPTLLAALSAIAAHQSNGTRAVTDACHQLLDYVATHPNASIQYKACNMVLSVHTTVISTYPTSMTKTSTMEPFSPCLPSSNTSCCQPPRQNLPHSTTAASLLPHFEPRRRNLATSN